MTGGARDYSKLVKMAIEKNFRVVGYNRRGHDGIDLESNDLNRLGLAEDAHEIFQYVQSMQPASNIYAVGVSAGAGMLATYAGTYKKEQSPLKAAVLVSHVHDFRKFLDQILPFYDKIMHKNVKNFLSKHKHKLASRLDIDHGFSQSPTWTHFEKNYGFRVGGYKSFDEYVNDNNPLTNFHKSNIPMLSLNSIDDPVVGPDLVPLDLIKKMENTIQVMTKRGG